METQKLLYRALQFEDLIAEEGLFLFENAATADLMFVAKQINMMTWFSAQSFGLALIIYFIMARFLLVPFLRWLEVLAARKVGRGKA